MDTRQGKWAVLFLIALAICATVAYGVATSEPEGTTTLDVLNSTRRSPTSASDKPAEAGNVTRLTIKAETVTQSWQGYYGNVSGKITLDDSAGRTMYEWNLTSPEGEVYAVNYSGTVDWSLNTIHCYNYSKSGGGYVSLSALEASFGIATHDIDGINETFRKKPQGATGTYYHDQFYVGQNYIDGESKPCPVVYLFNGSETNFHDTSAADPSGRIFQEVILYENASDLVIWTALLDEEDVNAFDDGPADFEMIVPENGHNGNSAVTQYYFYVEIE